MFKILFTLLFLTSLCFAKPAVLVTGGAGYIGTQTCKALSEAGFFPVAYDNLVRGHKEAVQWGVLEIGDISDAQRLSAVLDRYQPVAVIHCAAFKSVGESTRDPLKYYQNNVSGSISLLSVLKEKQIKNIVFSSSATLYGDVQGPLNENVQPIPLNPYGSTKWIIEQALQECSHAYGMEYVVLRYFNAAGADIEGKCGERGNTPANLVPILLQIAQKKGKPFHIFGDDYPTQDGTCIRDYVHVVDVATAHVKAVQYLLAGKKSITLNLGTGRGSSVKQVLELARQVTKMPIPAVVMPKREGDPISLVAETKRAEEALGWKPRYSELKTILESEWRWITR